jgi:hypothetical protein
MNEQELSSAQLLKLLEKIDFSRKYYDYYAKNSELIYSNQKRFTCTIKYFAAVGSTTALDFKYKTNERFFHHKQNYGNCELILNVAFPYSSVELIFYVKNEHGYVGGPFPKLAREVAQLSDPHFKYSPAAPKLPFSNKDELQQAVNFGISLFKEIKQAIIDEE